MYPILVIIAVVICMGLIANIIFFCWAIKNSMEYNDNLPPGINQDHEIWNSKEPKTKPCSNEDCKDGFVHTISLNNVNGDIISHTLCEICDGHGTIPMTEEDLLNEREAKKENQSEL